ncbi:MAG TPA: Tad domain-containing protein [Vicinamibacterales bacterium]|jgi:hypothetical protein
MLAQFALLVFGIFGVMALVIDMGIVTLTRVQMQNAADTAAIEGLRNRNVIDADGYASDCLRRIAARDVVRWTFDDDFDRASPDVDRQLGAGPIFDLTEGTGNLEGLRAISLPQQRAMPGDNVYKPNLQYNQVGNEVHGDMVSGSFTYDSSPAFSEAADYTRTDFAPAPSVPPGASATECPDERPIAWPGSPSGVAPLEAPAFLVRLRRTWDPDGLDEIADASDPAGSNGVSSNGGSVPLLFGNGTHLSEDAADPREYSVRRDGLNVRGTSIARTRAVLLAGPALVQPPVAPSLLGTVAVPGVTAFALTQFAALPAGMPVTASIDADGLITIAGDTAGQFVEASGRMTVGFPLPAAAASTCDPTAPTNIANDITWYTPLFEPIGAISRLVAFVPLQFTWDCTADPSSMVITRLSQIVASSNATALLPDGLPSDLTTTDLGVLLARTSALAGDGTALLAPVLAR